MVAIMLNAFGLAVLLLCMVFLAVTMAHTDGFGTEYILAGVGMVVVGFAEGILMMNCVRLAKRSNGGGKDGE